MGFFEDIFDHESVLGVENRYPDYRPIILVSEGMIAENCGKSRIFF